MSYVKEREAQLKREYQADMWWVRIQNFWLELGEALRIKRELDYYDATYSAMRTRYIKRGRRARPQPQPQPQPEVTA